ncbi:response regulator transcription factor [bacterium]|nr:MAG: response regulator transcription factor [bacterium]
MGALGGARVYLRFRSRGYPERLCGLDVAARAAAVRRMAISLLLVEDDPSIYDTLAPYAGREGWELRWARSVTEAKRAIEQQVPAVALIDRGLPGQPGDELAPKLRAREIPFLMLTARSEEAQRLSGFDLGADDYVTKPFSVAELARRIAVVLRRQGATRLRLSDGVELDREAQSVRVHGRDVALTATQYALLERLARHPGRVYTRADLADVLNLDLETSERTIDSHVKNIRKKLREAGAQDPLIETIVGVGYAARNAQ